jgi:hypothetical protein
MAYLDVKAQCNACGNAGARALCNMLIELRESGVAAVRAIHLWKNELGDEGACAIADLVASSAVEGAERFWVAEVQITCYTSLLYDWRKDQIEIPDTPSHTDARPVGLFRRA